MSELTAGNRSQPGHAQLHFVQWLRVFLMSRVVAHHAAQPYGPTGGEWPIDDPASSNILGAFFLFNSAFFMGFFFFISGYFVSGSYDRKGGVAFIRDRIVRLGIPLAIVCLFLFGPIAYLSSGSQDGFVNYPIVDYIGLWQIEMGPLWFIAQLLALNMIYALLRGILTTRLASEPLVLPVPGNRTILIYALSLGIAGMVVRINFRQDYWIDILGVIPAELVHAPQYWSLFAIGIFAGRGQWFEKIPSSGGPAWLAIGLVAFVIALVTQPYLPLFPQGMLPQTLTSLGERWGILWGLLEAFICVGLIVGLSVLFRDWFSPPNEWIRCLDQNVFGVYIFHVFILVGLQGAMLGVDLPALAKFAIVAIFGLTTSFLISGLLRLVPGVKRVV